MDTDDVLHAISMLPDPFHPSTQIAKRAAVEIEQLRAENRELREHMPRGALDYFDAQKKEAPNADNG